VANYGTVIGELRNVHIVTCQPFVGLRNRALLGSRPVNKSSAQPR
jgi:hypothetical protein